VSKLSIQLVQEHLLTESEEMKPSYDTMSAPNGKSRTIDKPKNLSITRTAIKQIEVPTSHKGKNPRKTAGKVKGGIPTAKTAEELYNQLSVPKMSAAKNQKSPASPKVVSRKTNQTSKQTVVKNPIKRTDGGKSGNAGIPAADYADVYTKKMPHGGSTLGTTGGKKVPEVNAPKAANLRGTTNGRIAPAKIRSQKANQSVPQVTYGKGFVSSPSDAPAKIKVAKHVKGHNVMESVKIMINGTPKATFGVIHKDVAAKLVESYKKFGYDVELHRADSSEWKQDRALLKKIYESMDAYYNGAPRTAQKLRKAAMDRFFAVSQSDYNTMYESRQQFSRTLKAAFSRIMEQADLKYRRSLNVVEGLARVEAGDSVIDLDMITQARDTNMALRNFRNEIVEEYGFNAKMKHVFINGRKYHADDIQEWCSK